jgi:hypothetical protein
MPRYWLTGEEKKLLWKLRGKEPHPDSSGDYWRHLIPRSEKELNFMLDMIPDNAIEEYRSNEAFSWEESQSRVLPDGTKEIRKTIYQANLKSSIWYFIPLQPFAIQPLPDGIPSNHYESKEWIPQVFDIANNTWRKASEWECTHWQDLVNCSSCKHPTIPQFTCNVCGDSLTQPLTDTEKRVLNLICILPDTTDFETTEQVVSEEHEGLEEKEQDEESTELEEVVEEQISEKVIEREEDEETKDTSDT